MGPRSPSTTQGNKPEGVSRRVSMTLRPQPILVVLAFALGLTVPWLTLPAGGSGVQPPARPYSR